MPKAPAHRIIISNIVHSQPSSFDFTIEDNGTIKKGGVTKATAPDLTTHRYFFEQLDEPKEITESGITKKIYHSQTIFTLNTTSTAVYPLWELKSLDTTTAQVPEIKDIGKIVLNITFLGTANNSTINDILTLVTTQKATGTTLTPNLDTTTTGAYATPIGTQFGNVANGVINKTNFKISGKTVTTSKKIKYVIDLNDFLQSTVSENYFAIGFETINAAVNTLVKVDTHVEVIS